jgi:hypothetical protein
MKWSGLVGIAFGAASSAIALGSLFRRPERATSNIMVGDINKAALALLLGSMFFTLAGSGLILISRPLIRTGSDGRPLRWPRFLAYMLYVYSAAVLGLGIVLITELGGTASLGIIAGLGAYCVLVAVGLLIASWGLRRFDHVG